MKEIPMRLLPLLCLLALFPEQVSGDTPQEADGKTLWAIVCANPQDAFAALYDVKSGNGINGSCHRLTVSNTLRETVTISSPYQAAFLDFGDHTALDIR